MAPRRRRLAAAVLVAVGSVVVAGRASAQSTTRVSVDSAGNQGNDGSYWTSISADGRFVAFESYAGNLVPGDTNSRADAFVHDRRTGETSRVSVDSAGRQGNSDSYDPSISGDGRLVAFYSSASDLVAGDSNGYMDVFVHDRQTGATVRVSVDSAGVQGNNLSLSPSISADGRFVAFVSSANNLVAGDTNFAADIFVHDLGTGETSRASLDSAGVEGSSGCDDPSISADGRFVAFESIGASLVPGDTNDRWDVFVRDRQTGATARVSVGPAGVQGNLDSFDAAISADGRFVVFGSYSRNLVPEDTNGSEDVFVHDRLTGETARASVDSSGVEANRGSTFSAISADGRFVGFSSFADNLVTNDGNGTPDAFVHDRLSGETSRVSVDSAGIGGDSNPYFLDLALSADGRFVAFVSQATNLVPDDTNGVADVFVRDRAHCREGNVNGGAGAVTDVLFVNDSAGGPERTVRLFTHEPLTIFVATPPAAIGLAPFALYAWPVASVPGAGPILLPFDIGETCLPTPLTGGTPAPRVVWNNTGSPLAGAATLPSSPAPSIVLQRPRAFDRPVDVLVQGIIRDPGATNGLAAVTNGVVIEIR